MNRLSKAILIILAGLVLVAVAASIAANLYIQSPRTQARIQEELGKALHVPLRITSTTITPWGGMRMTGITVPGEDGTSIEANSFSADYRILPLLRGELVVGKMILESPKIVWAQSADGKWRFPALPEPPKSAKPAGPSHEEKEKESKVTIGTLEIRNGSIDLIDNQKQHLASAASVEMAYTVNHREERIPVSGSNEDLKNGAAATSTVERKEEWNGSFAASKLTWSDALFFSQVHSSVHFKDGKLAFSNLSGALAGGSVIGALTFETDTKTDPFTMSLRIEKVDLARLTAEGNWQPGQSTGTLAGKISLHGTTDAFNEAEGDGSLTLADGQFHQLVYLQIIGQVLQIPELSDLHISSGQADFRIRDERTYIDQLELDSQDLQINAKGNARFDGRLDLEAHLTISERLSKQLPDLARGIILGNFSPADAQGRRSIAFDISGKTDKPKTNLLDKIIGQKLSTQVDDLLNGIFGGGKKKKKKDKDKESDVRAPANTPEPAATPPDQNGAAPMKQL